MREIGLLWRTIEADWDAQPEYGEYMLLGITSVPAEYDAGYDGLHDDWNEPEQAWRALVCERTLVDAEHGFIKLAPVRAVSGDVAEALCVALVADGWYRSI